MVHNLSSVIALMIIQVYSSIRNATAVAREIAASLQHCNQGYYS